MKSTENIFCEVQENINEFFFSLLLPQLETCLSKIKFPNSQGFFLRHTDFLNGNKEKLVGSQYTAKENKRKKSRKGRN